MDIRRFRVIHMSGCQWRQRSAEYTVSSNGAESRPHKRLAHQSEREPGRKPGRDCRKERAWGK